MSALRGQAGPLPRLRWPFEPGVENTFFIFYGNFFSFFAWKPLGTTPTFRGSKSPDFLSL
jgi:hypothetical protein